MKWLIFLRSSLTYSRMFIVSSTPFSIGFCIGLMSKPDLNRVAFFSCSSNLEILFCLVPYFFQTKLALAFGSCLGEISSDLWIYSVESSCSILTSYFSLGTKVFVVSFKMGFKVLSWTFMSFRILPLSTDSLLGIFMNLLKRCSMLSYATICLVLTAYGIGGLGSRTFRRIFDRLQWFFSNDVCCCSLIGVLNYSSIFSVWISVSSA